ncbi:hypothetical protein PIL02S_06261 [Paenibacillus illinoisensis]|jgi:hypothetical protein|uniref:Uncharacterized protein n=1 Tax=Paenibacillus illinoisensis TaxID=59845 RepID=A0A2W0CT04_9BACL|nr:hypothetical protein PIL02S_06261 [Paenibacillus illinoisensis]
MSSEKTDVEKNAEDTSNGVPLSFCLLLEEEIQV